MHTCFHDAAGTPAGFIRGNFIHDMHGSAIGQIRGTHVYKLSGPYVGERYRDVVVDRRLGRRDDIGNPGDPGNPGMPVMPRGRGAVAIAFADVFAELHVR